MPVNVGVWRIDNNVTRLDFSPLNLEVRLEEILERDISIAAPHWMIVGRQVHTPTDQRIDLLAIDADGNLVVLEIKRDRTPRDVVGQVLDYGSWAHNLNKDNLRSIFQDYVALYHPEWGSISLDEAFNKRFNADELPDEVNQSHELVIVASSLDTATERIVKYLVDYHRVAINVIFFHVFKDEYREYLTRAWMVEPTIEPPLSPVLPTDTDWNGEYYVSFGEDRHRSWNDAIRYGFVSAGGGEWYTKTLAMLKAGDRVWVNIPRRGYVGVGHVKGIMTPVLQFPFCNLDGTSIPIEELKLEAPDMLEERQGEQLIAVEWIRTLPTERAIQEKGLFGNQNTVARPRTTKWTYTIERLKQRFGVA